MIFLSVIKLLKPLRTVIACITSVFMLAGCLRNDVKEAAIPPEVFYSKAVKDMAAHKYKEAAIPPEVFYSKAVKDMAAHKYKEAAENFSALEREYPNSKLALPAQVRRAYSKYMDGNFAESLLVIDDFVKQYPADNATPYMYYLRALCYYDQILDVGRDQQLSVDAISAFEELINRFPNTKYARDAKLKIDYAVNLLAGKEMEIGRFYFDKKAFIAALGRFKKVVDDYQQTIFIAEGLYRMIETYYALGDKSQASNYYKVLVYNYPENEWTIKADKLVNGI